MSKFQKPPFKGDGGHRRDMPEGLWHKCPSCGAVIHELELKQSIRVCAKCKHHFTLNARDRIDSLCDPSSFRETDSGLDSVDALGFKSYREKVEKYQKITGLKDAVVTGKAQIGGIAVVIGVMDNLCCVLWI